MTTTDPIAGVFTRVRNVLQARHETVEIPVNKEKVEIARVLKNEGFITGYTVDGDVKKTVTIALKYGLNNEKVISGLKRIPKPSLRVYAKADSIPRVMNGPGIVIASTSHGMITGKGAKIKHAGGEVIAYVWQELSGGKKISRISNKAITIPVGVEVTIAAGSEVTVKGSKGTLTRQFNPALGIKVEENVLAAARSNDEKHVKQLHGTTRALLANMVEGMSEGFIKELELVGIDFRAAVSGSKLTLNVGYSHPAELTVEDGLKVECSSATDIKVSGVDKQRVDEFAASICAVRKPEPYKGKGIRYKGEYVRRKEGKTTGKK